MFIVFVVDDGVRDWKVKVLRENWAEAVSLNDLGFKVTNITSIVVSWLVLCKPPRLRGGKETPPFDVT